MLRKEKIFTQQTKLMKNMTSKLYWIVLFFVVFLSLIIATSTVDVPGGYALFTVQSGSMEPVINKGAIVLVKTQETYETDDIITFNSKENGSLTITHRIKEIKLVNDLQFFITKGDANDAVDTTLVEKADVIGKVLVSIPMLGYPIAFARTQTGLIALVVIPATIIIYSELMTIKNEAVRLLKERKMRKLSLLENAEVAVGMEVMDVQDEIKATEKKIEEKFFKKKKKNTK